MVRDYVLSYYSSFKLKNPAEKHCVNQVQTNFTWKLGCEFELVTVWTGKRGRSDAHWTRSGPMSSVDRSIVFRFAWKIIVRWYGLNETKFSSSPSERREKKIRKKSITPHALIPHNSTTPSLSHHRAPLNYLVRPKRRGIARPTTMRSNPRHDLLLSPTPIDQTVAPLAKVEEKQKGQIIQLRKEERFSQKVVADFTNPSLQPKWFPSLSF